MLKFRVKKMLQTSEGKQALDISFELEKGRLLTIYGPSGAGKTTILRIIAGLTDPDSGMIEAGGEIWQDTEAGIHTPPQKRSVGLVFQDFALFPNLTVKQNLEFALPKTTGKNETARSKAEVAELIALLELGQLQDSPPARLSGGQQQRVALARAIVRKPRILLLDEALSALDDEMRWKLQDYILRVHRHYRLTTILVSHYLPEIFRLSDEVICLEGGKIGRRGRPGEVFLEERISNKFKLVGEIVEIFPSDIVFIVSVLCANTIVKVIATAEEAKILHTGQKVMVASKAFNPVILPID